MKWTPFQRPLAAIVAIAFVAACAAGCGGGNLATELAKPPVNPNKESKCGTTKIQARPLIVEWPSSDRAALEGRIKQGLVPVRYVGCEMEVLTTCRVAAQYGYTGITPKSDRVVIHNSDELYANIPVHAAKFEGKLQKAGALEVAMTIIGRYESNRPAVRANELQGECKDATHVISALTVGAFKFSAGAAAEVAAQGGIGNMGAAGRSAASNETLSTDGDDKQCERARGDDKAPPFGCGALLRVELVPLGDAGMGPPACPGGTIWDGNQCVASKTCPAGTRFEAGKGCVPDLVAAAASAPVQNAGSGGGPVDAHQKGCDGGDARACVTLGEMFYNARGVIKDGPRAAVLFKKACDKGEPTGCVDLAWAYLSGTGVEKNAKTAADLFGAACTGSTTVGCLGLGTLYQSGSGVARDLKRAASLFKQACDAGNSAGCKMAKDVPR